MRADYGPLGKSSRALTPAERKALEAFTGALASAGRWQASVRRRRARDDNRKLERSESRTLQKQQPAKDDSRSILTPAAAPLRQRESVVKRHFTL